MIRKAAIDIGTNTTRLLIADSAQNGTFKEVFCRRIITRLGEGFSNHKHLNEIAVQRTLNALTIYSKDIKKHNCSTIRSVATSAVREADNGKEFVQKVKRETALHIEIISQEEEARLAVLGVFSGLKEKPEKAIIFDVGGGSTEFILTESHADPVKRRGAATTICQGEPNWTDSEGRPPGGVRPGPVLIPVEGMVEIKRRYRSGDLTEKTCSKNKFSQSNIIKIIGLPMGVVHLTEKYVHSDPVNQKELQALRMEVKNKLSRVKKEIGNIQDFTLIGTAGTPTQFAALDLDLMPYDPAAVNGHKMSLSATERIFNELKSKTTAERKAIRAMEHGREDLIIAGGVVLLETMELFNTEELTISDFGLREGLIIGV